MMISYMPLNSDGTAAAPKAMTGGRPSAFTHDITVAYTVGSIPPGVTVASAGPGVAVAVCVAVGNVPVVGVPPGDKSGGADCCDCWYAR